jgi:hypothetical protein
MTKMIEVIPNSIASHKGKHRCKPKAALLLLEAKTLTLLVSLPVPSI